MAWCDVVELRTLRECRLALGQSQAVARMLKKSVGLRERIENSRTERTTPFGEKEIVFTPEMERVKRVVIKNARGHALYELDRGTASVPPSCSSEDPFLNPAPAGRRLTVAVYETATAPGVRRSEAAGARMVPPGEGNEARGDGRRGVGGPWPDMFAGLAAGMMTVAPRAAGPGACSCSATLARPGTGHRYEPARDRGTRGVTRNGSCQ